MPKDAGGAGGGARSKGGMPKEWPHREKRGVPKDMPPRNEKRDMPKQRAPSGRRK